MNMRNSILALVLLAWHTAADAEISAEAHVFSEVVDRGIALTDGEAALGASLTWDSSSGLFAGGGAFYSDGSPWRASRTRNYQAFVGWFRELGEARALEVSAFRSKFPDVENWDYNEFRADYHLNPEVSVTLAWSPDYYGRGAESLITAGSWRPELSDSAYLLLSGGAGRLASPLDTTIYFGQVGIGYRAGRFDTALSVSMVDSDTEQIFFTDDTTIALRLSYLVL